MPELTIFNLTKKTIWVSLCLTNPKESHGEKNESSKEAEDDRVSGIFRDWWSGVDPHQERHDGSRTKRDVLGRTQEHVNDTSEECSVQAVLKI